MKCFNCLKPMRVDSTTYNYYCGNYSCDYYFALDLNEKDIIYYFVAKHSGNNRHRLIGDQNTNCTSLYLHSSQITIETSFINISLDNYLNEIPNLINKLLKLKVFI